MVSIYVTNGMHACPSDWLNEQYNDDGKRKSKNQCANEQAIDTPNGIDSLCGFIYYFKTETLNTYGYFVYENFMYDAWML